MQLLILEGKKKATKKHPCRAGHDSRKARANSFFFIDRERVSASESHRQRGNGSKSASILLQ
jgi:hypothetical protein